MKFYNGDKSLIRVLCRPAGLLAVLIMAFSSLLLAAEPEYMKLKIKPGQAYEIEVKQDKSGNLVATDIETLPQERLPKLRAAIQQIDYKDSTMTLYGIPVRIYEHTEFVDNGGEKATFEGLKEGQRVEVSCKFDDNGKWLARKIKAKDVKTSDKIKGTISRVAIDGKPPDTLDISGLLIILIRETDVNDPSSMYQGAEKILFADQVLQSAPLPGGSLADRLYLTGDYRQSIRSEKEYDLSDYIQSDIYETEPELRMELAGIWSKNLRTFIQLRVRQRFLLDGSRNDNVNRRLLLNITQLYAVMRNIGNRGLALQVGRQEFKESREWIYDEYLDAIHLYYYGRQPLIFEAAYVHAVSPLKTKFRTWTDIIGQARWVFNKTNQLGIYLLSRKDSDSTINREPFWFGFRYFGLIKESIRPWMELSFMRGNEGSQKLRATALDMGATVRAKMMPLAPSATVAYAQATGDKTGHGPIDYTFRQTGYEDNADYSGGVTRLRYYGELLDPELSNLRIITFGLGVRPTSATSIDIIYHTFHQDQPYDRLRGANLIDPPARPNAVSKDIGWELDFVLGAINLWNRVTLGWTTGIFKPGQAFQPYMKTATLNRLNLKIEYAI